MASHLPCRLTFPPTVFDDYVHSVTESAKVATGADISMRLSGLVGTPPQTLG